MVNIETSIYGNELKNKIERFIQKIKDRTQNVLMIIFRVERIAAIYNMYIIGSNYFLYFTYT